MTEKFYKERRPVAEKFMCCFVESTKGFIENKGLAEKYVRETNAYERMLTADALARTDNNVAAAADRLGVPKKTLYDKIKKYQLVAGRSTEG